MQASELTADSEIEIAILKDRLKNSFKAYLHEFKEHAFANGDIQPQKWKQQFENRRLSQLSRSDSNSKHKNNISIERIATEKSNYGANEQLPWLKYKTMSESKLKRINHNKLKQLNLKSKFSQIKVNGRKSIFRINSNKT